MSYSMYNRLYIVYIVLYSVHMFVNVVNIYVPIGVPNWCIYTRPKLECPIRVPNELFIKVKFWGCILASQIVRYCTGYCTMYCTVCTYTRPNLGGIVHIVCIVLYI